jgi:glycine cleavage system H protein
MSNKKYSDNPEKLSRREFLKSTGAIIGGVMLAPPALSAACNKENTSGTAVSESDLYYIANNLGGSSRVALDRLYSIEHIWVKKLGSNVVQLGVTDKYQALIGLISQCWLSEPGTVINMGDSFGTLEGMKTNAALISPVSGEVTETNQYLLTNTQAEYVNIDPYVNGWLLEIRLSQPHEMEELLAPMYYAYLQTREWTGPIPAMH